MDFLHSHFVVVISTLSDANNQLAKDPSFEKPDKCFRGILQPINNVQDGSFQSSGRRKVGSSEQFCD
jgi:hypothetical protein